MLALGQWALALLIAGTCPTPTAWVEVSSVRAVCGDDDGIPVLNARNPWALPWDPLASREQFNTHNERARVRDLERRARR